MRGTITKDQLFRSAIILHDDIDRYTAVIQSVSKDQIDIVDIYGGETSSVSLNSIRPCPINHYVLRRLGFEETEPLSTCYTFPTDDQKLCLAVRQKRNAWLLQVGPSTIYVSSAHQLQLVIWSITGVMLELKPIEMEDDTDWEWAESYLHANVQ